MAVTGQIEVIEPDSGKKRYYSESGDIGSDLVDAVENAANPDGVVVLNPGDYTGVGTVDVPSDVTVVLMPGAIVSYASNFRTNGDFGTSGAPVNNSSHPLRSSVSRYNNPDFTGAVENIVDLNFGSEWAFETDLEDLRQTVQGEIVGGEFFWNIESGDLSSSTQTRFSSSISVKSGASPTRTLRFEDTEGTAFNLTEGDIDKDGTDEITIRAENRGVVSLSAGRLLQLGNERISFVTKQSVDGEIGGDVVDFVFADSGTRLYVLDDTSFITEFSLTTPYNLAGGLTEEDEFDTSGQDGSQQDLVLSNDGTKLFVVGGSTDTVYEYDLGTAYEIETATFNSNSLDISSQTSNPSGIDLGLGDQVLIVSDTTQVYEYNLSTAADITSASFDEILDASAEVTTAVSVDFSRDGEELFIADSDDTSVAIYDLGTEFDLGSALFRESLDVSGSGTNEFSITDLVGVFDEPFFGGKFFLGDTDGNEIKEFKTAGSGNVLIFHRDVAVDSAGFDELGEELVDNGETVGVRVVSNLDINKSEPPTGGGTFDGHVKRIDSIDLVEGNNIDIKKDPQPNSPDEFEISVPSGAISTDVTVTDPENNRSFGGIDTLNFSDKLDVTSPNAGEAKIDHGDTGTSFSFSTENVVETDDAGHVQEAVTVGTSSSLQVDDGAGTLEHDVSPTPSDNTTTGTFLETIQFDANGHVESASFSSASGGPSISDLALNYAAPTLELENTDTSTTIDTADILPRSIYDQNGDARATATTSVGANNVVGLEVDGTLLVESNVRVDSGGVDILGSSADISFFEDQTAFDNDTSIADIFYNTNDDELSLLSSNSMDITAIGSMTIDGFQGIDFESNQGTISFDAPNFGVDMDNVQKLTILGDFEFRDGFLALKPRSSDIDPENDIPEGWAALYAIVDSTDVFGNITDIDLRWAENLEDGSIRLADIDGS